MLSAELPLATTSSTRRRPVPSHRHADSTVRRPPGDGSLPGWSRGCVVTWTTSAEGPPRWTRSKQSEVTDGSQALTYDDVDVDDPTGRYCLLVL